MNLMYLFIYVATLATLLGSPLKAQESAPSGDVTKMEMSLQRARYLDALELTYTSIQLGFVVDYEETRRELNSGSLNGAATEAAKAFLKTAPTNSNACHYLIPRAALIERTLPRFVNHELPPARQEALQIPVNNIISAAKMVGSVCQKELLSGEENYKQRLKLTLEERSLRDPLQTIGKLTQEIPDLLTVRNALQKQIE